MFNFDGTKEFFFNQLKNIKLEEIEDKLNNPYKHQYLS